MAAQASKGGDGDDRADQKPQAFRNRRSGHLDRGGS
jgi:hypothetical protein